MEYLGMEYGVHKQFDLAVPMVTSAYQTLQEELGEEHPTTLHAGSALAYLYQWQGKYAESEALDIRLLEMKRRVLGVNHPSTSLVVQRLLRTYERQGKLDQAVSLLTERLPWLRKDLTSEPHRLASPIAYLGRLLLQQKKYAEAEPLLREARKLAESLPETSLTPFWNLSNLGACLAGQGKYEEAEGHLLSAYRGLKERESNVPPQFGEWTDDGQLVIGPRERLTQVGQRIIDLYTAWGKPEEAAKWRAELDVARETSK